MMGEVEAERLDLGPPDRNVWALRTNSVSGFHRNSPPSFERKSLQSRRSPRRLTNSGGKKSLDTPCICDCTVLLKNQSEVSECGSFPSSSQRNVSARRFCPFAKHPEYNNYENCVVLFCLIYDKQQRFKGFKIRELYLSHAYSRCAGK